MSLGLIKRRSSMLGYEWCTVSGTSNISLPNSMESNFRNIKILGNSRYKTYAGTNLLDVKLYDQNKTDNGLTFETQVDGSIIVSGNSTGVSTFYFGEYIDLLEDGKSYIYKSVSPRGTLNITYSDGTPNDYLYKITVDKSRMSSIRPYIQFNMTNLANGILHVYPVLNEGTVIKPWEPATGGKPVTKSSPDIPLEIESCGYRGKNLLDFKTAKEINGNASPEMLENGFVIEAMYVDNRIVYVDCNLKAGKSYIMNLKTKKIIGSDIARLDVHLPEIQQYFSLNRPFVPNQDVSKVGIYVDASRVPAKFEVTDIQVEEGTTATPYEPYSDKYFVDLKVTGRNILNSDSGYSTFTPFYAKAGTKFTMITNGIESDGGNIKFIGEDGSDVWFGIDKGRMKSTIIIKENVKGFTNELKKKDGLKYSMVIGDTDEYEPYVEKTVQIALDKPLYKADRWYDYGTSRDALKKDGVIRCFEEFTITKDTMFVCDLGIYGALETNTILCRHHNVNLRKYGGILCNELPMIENWLSDIESVYMTEQSIDFRLSRERLGLGPNTTIEENKAAVQKWLEMNPIHCIIELNEPVFEPFSPELQSQLQAIYAESGTTNILLNSGNVPAGIEATYKMKSN